jgi:hypothetical protein
MALALVGLVTWVCCSPFEGDGGSGASNNGGCWPGLCPKSQICCVARDGTSSCRDSLADCSEENAVFTCRFPSDCPGQKCCQFPRKFETDGSATIPIIQTACFARCDPDQSQAVLCKVPTDCDAGTCRDPSPAAVPSSGYSVCR